MMEARDAGGDGSEVGGSHESIPGEPSNREPGSRLFDLGRLRTHPFLREVSFVAECRSTSDLALNAARTNAALPHLFLTDQQTGGRGRGTNRWWAADGALTFSLLVAPSVFGIDGRMMPQSSPVAALAVSDALARFVPEAMLQLKWPNDVWLKGRKVSGILIEPVTGIPDRISIGIGINVGNSFADAPVELRSIATSIADETGANIPLTDLLLELLTELERNLRALGHGQHALVERWNRRCALTGQFISLQAADRQVTGLCHGINPDGAILVESEGEIRPWFGGVVRPVA